jgi:hypothetical protein
VRFTEKAFEKTFDKNNTPISIFGFMSRDVEARHFHTENLSQLKESLQDSDWNREMRAKKFLEGQKYGSQVPQMPSNSKHFPLIFVLTHLIAPSPIRLPPTSNQPHGNHITNFTPSHDGISRSVPSSRNTQPSSPSS